MEIINCPECNQNISDKAVACPYCGYPINNLDSSNKLEVVPKIIECEENEKTTEVQYIKTTEVNKKENKILNKINNHKSLITIVACTLAIVMSLSLGIGIPVSRNVKYRKIQEGLMSFTYMYELEEIGEMINSLPYDYKDISTYNMVYKMIMNEVLVIEDAYNYNLTDEKCEQARTSYRNLVVIGNTSYLTNVNNYLNNVGIRVLVYGQKWGGEYPSNYLYWYDSESGEFLSVNLPNAQDSEKEYYFTTSYSIFGNMTFGYKNRNDSSDDFNAYKITKAVITSDKEYICVYCYSNEQTYTLYAND